jgi:hypothetical protein
VIRRLPILPPGHVLYDQVVHRVLLLNCLTRDYEVLWNKRI